MATKTQPKGKHRSIEFDRAELAMLERVAEEQDSNVSQLVRRLVRGYLNQYLKKNGGKP